MPFKLLLSAAACCALTMSEPAPAADAAPGTGTVFGPYTVTVAAEGESGPGQTDFQIAVSEQDLTLTRLSAPYVGTLSKSFVADLDQDGGFEVVVTYTEPTSHATGIKVFSWKNALLEPRKLADLDAGQGQGYRGGDEVAVLNGRLVRIFQVYEEQNGEWTATAAQRRLHYSFENSRWVAD